MDFSKARLRMSEDAQQIDKDIYCKTIIETTPNESDCIGNSFKFEV